jgi:hypothetical protein
MLDACPRLSLLPYHRLRELQQLWLAGPLQHLPWVSRCFHEMFEGVGSLRVEELPVQRLHVCRGFMSSDKAETIIFDAPLSLSLSLDDFINSFEQKIRESITRGCDNMNSHRIDMNSALLTDVLTDRVMLCANEIFHTRISMVKPQESVDLSVNCNQSVVLINLSVFAEDVWLCLGFCVGAVLLAKPDLQRHMAAAPAAAAAWRHSLTVLSGVSTEMIAYCRVELADSNTSQQRRALCSSLLQLECGHLQCVRDLLQCNCRESALEMWSGRYQLRFLYDPQERVRACPFEVTMGCVALPYGMEYYGGLFPLHLGPG